MNHNRRPQSRQPAQMRPMAVRRVDNPPKKSGCGGFGAAMFIFVILGIAILMLTGILPSPFETHVTPPPQIDNATPNYFITPVTSETVEPTAVETPQAEATPTPQVQPTDKPTPTDIPKSMPFVLRGTPEGYPNALLHPQYDCEEYLFIGGEVWDLREAPVLGLIIRLTGTYGGGLVDFTSESGDVKLYGQSGFEFVMENKQIAEDNLTIQLFDQNNNPLSAPVKLKITGRCNANLIIVNYKQVQEISEN
jgi:hypothetical protein